MHLTAPSSIAQIAKMQSPLPESEVLLYQKLACLQLRTQVERAHVAACVLPNFKHASRSPLPGLPDASGRQAACSPWHLHCMCLSNFLLQL